jgi:hypothetical protein
MERSKTKAGDGDPIAAATIIRKLRVAAIAPRPFILAGDFPTGEDRRAPFAGEDRRTRLPKKPSVSPGGTAAFLSARPAGAEVVLVEL